MAKSVSLIFDIGKTNKKLFLFDGALNIIEQEYASFDETPDDEGFLSEDLNALTKWIKHSVDKVLNNPKYDLKTINFSTYGASLVHLDKDGNVIAPFYNYLKPFPEDLKADFLKKHGAARDFPLANASPFMGFLNSGLQLYYLKYQKPEIFNQLHYSLHFPQYLSFLFTGKFSSEFTSLGCHTGLWDFENNSYAQWVKDEGFEKHLAPIQGSSKTFQTTINGRSISIGLGVHDSSAALTSYIQKSTAPFALISTGTWNICLNPFNASELTASELQNDCLNFLGTNGKSIKISRLFLGQEFQEQVMQLEAHFSCDKDYYKSVIYNKEFIPLINNQHQLVYQYVYLKPERFGFNEQEKTNYNQFTGFDQAYHQLIHELTELQIASLQLALGDSDVKTIYIDGGFTDNLLFIKMLTHKLPEFKIPPSKLASGSALGAAMLLK
jgi:sugar (pentulose or hexulose) kinase